MPEYKLTRKKQFIDFDLVLRIIDEIKEIKLTDTINFYLMGESLLHDRVIDILRYAKENGIKVKLNTNGSLLNSEMRKKLLSLNIDNLSISYHESYVKHPHDGIKPFTSFEDYYNNIISTINDKYT